MTPSQLEHRPKQTIHNDFTLQPQQTLSRSGDLPACREPRLPTYRSQIRSYTQRQVLDHEHARAQVQEALSHQAPSRQASPQSSSLSPIPSEVIEEENLSLITSELSLKDILTLSTSPTEIRDALEKRQSRKLRLGTGAAGVKLVNTAEEGKLILRSGKLNGDKAVQKQIKYESRILANRASA